MVCVNSRLRSGWYLTLSPAFTLTAPNTCKMKRITANPPYREGGSPLGRAYLLLLSSQSPLKSYPDLCFSTSRLTAMCSHWQANSFWTLPYANLSLCADNKWSRNNGFLFFFFAAEHPRRPCARSVAHAAQGDAVALPSPVAVTHALVRAGRTPRFSLNRDAKMNLLLQETELVVQKATNYWIMICFGALLAKPSTKALILRLFSFVLLGGFFLLFFICLFIKRS